MLIALALLGVLGLEDHEMKSGDNRAGKESLRVFSLIFYRGVVIPNPN